MFKDLIQLFGDLNWERLIVLVIVFALGIGATLMYESHTHSFALTRLDRSANLLAKLDEIKAGSAENKPDLNDRILESLYSELHEISQPTETARALERGYLKSMLAFVPWLLMALVFLTSSDGNERRSWIGFFGAISFGVLYGGVAAIIPDLFWPWGNLMILPFGLWLITMILFAMLGRSSNAA